MIRYLGWCLMVLGGWAYGQEFVVRGLSVYGQYGEDEVPVIVRDSTGQSKAASQFITIQFDVQGKEPPQLKIRFLHCNRDWVPDRNLFVQDEVHNTSFILDYLSSPNGVEYYSYRYKNRFPDEDDIVRFNYSGNWIFQLMDKEEKNVFGGGRFFVVDDVSRVAVAVTNEYLTDAVSPLNQVHKVKVNVQLPNEVEGYFYTTVDVYQNWRFFNPYRIDVNDRDPYTTVEGFNLGYRTFTIRNLLPGNEYRTLDISNTTRYPNRSVVRLVEGADQPRPYWRTGEDRNGTAQLNSFTGLNSDYLEVLFRLDLSSLNLQRVLAGNAGVYVASPFNQWNPTAKDRLEYDNLERCYVVRKLLRRGIYDYQYITGNWDEDVQDVANQDWISLEGNDWRTTDTYYTMIYYNDARFGGFDRIVGFGVGRSPGTGSATN